MVASSLRHPITIGEVTYDVSPLDDASHQAMDEWVRSKYVERSAPMIEALKSEEDKRIALSVAYKASMSLSWLSPEGARMLGTIEGVARLLYEGVRKNHPNVTFQDIRNNLRDAADVRRATQVFEHLNSGGKQPEETAEIKKARRNRAKKSLSRKKKST